MRKLKLTPHAVKFLLICEGATREFPHSFGGIPHSVAVLWRKGMLGFRPLNRLDGPGGFYITERGREALRVFA